MGQTKEISRVTLTTEAIKESYGKMSKLYVAAEGIFEKGLRKKGLKLLDIQEGETVLEIGFGTGFSLSELAESVGKTGKAYGIDVTPEMVEITRKRLQKDGLMDRAELSEGDVRSIAFKDNSFDAVYMASTLELFDTLNIPKVLEEIRRVLKRSGRLVLVSMSKEGQKASLFLRFYEWLHEKIPKYVSCRPIYVEDSLREAGYRIIRMEEFMLARLIPVMIVAAKP